MPYILPERRTILQPVINEVVSWVGPADKNYNIAHHLLRMIISIYYPEHITWYCDRSDNTIWNARANSIQKTIVQLDEITPGDLNYLICMILIRLFHLDHPKYINIDSTINVLESLRCYVAHHPPTRSDTQLYDRVIGTLTCVQLELYRRLAWYEDSKIEQNGDIFDKKD